MSEERIRKLLPLIKEIIDALKGKVDFKKRLDILLNPDNPQTCARLSVSQVEYVRDAHLLKKLYPEFEPFFMDAKELCLTSISKNGLGREEAIRYEGAINEAKLMRSIGITKEVKAGEEKNEG